MEIYRDDDYCWEEHEMTDSFMDYKNPQVSNLLKGYPGNTKIRLGVLFFDKTGRPYFVRHLLNVRLDDYITKKRNISGNHLLKHYDHYTSSEGTPTYRQHNANITSLVIEGIDITDIKDKIGGFSIVRVAIVHNKIGTALIGPVRNMGSNDLKKYSYGYMIESELSSRKTNTYIGYSPESLFDFEGFNLQSGDKLENAMYLKPYKTTPLLLSGAKFFPGIVGNTYQKLYEERNSNQPPTGKGKLDESEEILYHTKFNIGEDEVVVDPRTPNIVYRKESHLWPQAYSSNCLILVTKEDEEQLDADDYIGRVGENSYDTLFLVCDIKRDNNNPYGGINDASLSNSIYMTLGHYQVINEEVLSDIEEDGRFIFDEIQVFGGDTFINLFPISRTIQNLNSSLPATQNTSHTIVFPVESRINIAMREGSNVAKDLPWHVTESTLGIRYKDDDHKWEEFNYNDGYSTDDIKDFYLPIPYNWENESLRPARIRFSLEKNYGEEKDSFRIFPPLQLLDLSINDGEITNIREKSNMLIYWQKNVVGYIPINERALTQGAFGQPIQLGVGGLFERYDKIIDTIGNSNQFSLIESDYGFHWYDSIRKILLSLSNNMELNEDSIVKGLDNFFNTIPDISNKDNPLFGEGISSGYDYKNKSAFFVFHLSGKAPQTIGINMKVNAFLGDYTFPASSFINIRNNLIGLKRPEGNNKFYLHTDKKEFGTYYGIESAPHFDMIFIPERIDPVIWDNIEITGNENICSNISFNSYNKEVVEQIIRYIPEKKVTNKNWGYRNNKWYGNIPFSKRTRLVNDYLRIRFIFDSGFTYEQFITLVKIIYRQMF